MGWDDGDVELDFLFFIFYFLFFIFYFLFLAWEVCTYYWVEGGGGFYIHRRMCMYVCVFMCR